MLMLLAPEYAYGHRGVTLRRKRDSEEETSVREIDNLILRLSELQAKFNSVVNELDVRISRLEARVATIESLTAS